jgi:hypothetical protein
MDVKLLLDYEIIDEDINCKCIVKCLGKPIFIFNCHTKYIDRAEESVCDVMENAFVPMLTRACQERHYYIHELNEE